MALPRSTFAPPFNVTRASHVVLNARDTGVSCDFYVNVIGLVVTHEENGTVYLRGLEEACHHSLIIEPASEATCRHIGVRVASDGDLRLAKDYFDRRGLKSTWADRPFQGRSLQVEDIVGTRIELCSSMEVVPRRMQEFHTFRGGSPQRLDHFQIATHDVAAATSLYCELGFQITEYTANDNDEELWGTWLQRKGNTHDLVFTNGVGPRLHHFAYTVNDVHDLIHACDTAGSYRLGDVIDRGPGRHGISNALFAYFRDPDGHRIELFTTHYQAIDRELSPIRWPLSDARRSQLWGMPASKRWFYEASPFEGKPLQEPVLKAEPVTLEHVLSVQH